MTISLNPAHVIVGSNQSLPLEGDAMTKIASHTIDIAEDDLWCAREELIDYACPLCKEMGETDLPPL